MEGLIFEILRYVKIDLLFFLMPKTVRFNEFSSTFL